jgi:V-type H+-transporting ATPase proteolipid subunit
MKSRSVRHLFSHNFRLSILLHLQLASGLCCGLSCLAAGGCIGILGDVGVRGFGIRASSGRKFYMGAGNDMSDDIGGDDGLGNSSNPVEGANKLYVGMLIMLIFSEALALYGLIVALILSQHSYLCLGNA